MSEIASFAKFLLLAAIGSLPEWQLSACIAPEAASRQSAQKLPIEAFLNYMTGIGPEGDCQLSAFEYAKADIAVPKGMDCEKAAVRSP